jgi:membrane-bound lytic murein transglycosylase D
MRRLLAVLILVLGFSAARAGSGCDTLFYIPEVLQDNVEFWKMIYQKIPHDRGLLHDQDTFRVVYDTLIVSTIQGRARSRGIVKREKEIAETLRKMASLDTAVWDPKMRAYAALWGRALTGEELLAASKRVRFQLGQRDQFIAGLKRSGRYLDKIKEIFRSYDLPEALAYLPHVESSFNYRAYSKVGAAGIWQFMRGTGRIYMKVGYIIDERLDPIKATHAAAKLLRNNYQRLSSWPLAVTAYNHGVNSMERAVAQTGTTDFGVIIDRYQTHSFQFASKNFYASFLAAYQTAVDYKAFFGDVEVEPTFTYTECPLPKAYRPSNLAGVFHVSPHVLQEYNLDIRPTIFKANQYLPKDYVLKLPAEYASLDRDSILGRVPEKVALEVPPQTGFHKVETGENLERISMMYQVKLSDLLNLNNLDIKGCIYPGQVIAIPGKGVVVMSAGPEKPEVCGTLAAPQAEVALAPAAAAPVPRLTSVVVKPKDTLAAAAVVPIQTPAPNRAFAVPAYLLAEKPVPSNAADSLQNLWAYLYPAAMGLSLVGVRKCGFCEFNADYYDLGYVNQTPSTVTIRVEVDETIGHYAEWTGITSSKIRSLNRVSANIYLGERISLPLSGEAAVAFLKARIEHHMSIEEDFFNNYEVTGMDTLAVKSGTNVWTLCQENEIPLWLFLKSNPAIKELRSVQPGKILLPQIEGKK